MTNKLKCPICGGDIQYDNSYSTYDCQNNSSEHYASEEVWQALIQAKQDLETATKALDWIGNNRLAENPVRVEQLRQYARKALEQIEHKEM